MASGPEINTKLYTLAILVDTTATVVDGDPYDYEVYHSDFHGYKSDLPIFVNCRLDTTTSNLIISVELDESNLGVLTYIVEANAHHLNDDHQRFVISTIPGGSNGARFSLRRILGDGTLDIDPASTMADKIMVYIRYKVV